MSFSRLFYSGRHKVIGMYSSNPGVIYAEPPGARHLAHVTWFDSFKGRDSNIDYFLVEGKSLQPSEAVQINEDSRTRNGEIEDRLNFRYRILGEMCEHEQLVRTVAIKDVERFMEAKENKRFVHAGFWGDLFEEARKKRKSKKKVSPKMGAGKVIDFVEEINGTGVIFQGDAHIQWMGKQDYYPGCILDINLDFARWCQSAITPDGKLAPWNTCDYCYSGHTHSGFPYAYVAERANISEQIREIRKLRALEEKPTRYLRLGKRTECGARFFRNNLINTLEACADEGIKCIFPTKFLEFDSEIADLLKRTDSSLLVSLGNDGLEKGAVLNGRTQMVRIEDGIKYEEAGVRTIPYAMVDAALKDGGEYFEKSLGLAIKNFKRVQILPLRLRHVEKAKRIMGGWDSLMEGDGQKSMFGEEAGAYEASGDSTRVCTKVHPSLSMLVDNNNGNCRMCHHCSKFEACGMCFMSGESPFFKTNLRS